MALEVLECPNCGAPMPPNVVEAVVVCIYCTRSVVNPHALPAGARHAQAPVQAAPVQPAPAQAAAVMTPMAAPVAGKPAAKVPPGSGAEKPAAKADPSGKGPPKVLVDTSKLRGEKAPANALRKGAIAIDDSEESEDDQEVFEWTEESITAFAQEALGAHDSLFFDPKIPRDKLKAARATHKESLDDDERVLVLYDDTVFGGADDGFIVTTEQFAWKNLGEDPKRFLWEEIDPEGVEWSGEALTVMGEEVHATQTEEEHLLPMLAEFISEMAAMAAELEEEE